MMLLMDNIGFALFLFCLAFITPFVLLAISAKIEEDKPKLAKYIAILAGIWFLVGLGYCSGIV